MRHLVTTLDDIEPTDAARVGGKAFNCARLKRAGIAVPDGIVLTTDAMGKPLDIPELHDWLARLPSGTLLAVRSSGTDEDSAGFSFAGIHETTLNVAPAGVPAAVRVCWASVASPQAVAYRRERNLPTEHPRTAVLVQKMVQPIASGVAFTVNPITGATDEILINSVFGLGEALVSGRVEPDEFRLRKSGEVLSAHLVHRPPSLTDVQLGELASLLLTIETHYGAPQDVEWCHDGTQFWIVQSRPVTTGPITRKTDTEWTRANSREVLPDLPSHLAATWFRDALNRTERELYGRLVAPDAELGPITTIFCGRIYANVEQLRSMCRRSGFAPAVVLRSMGHQDEIAPEDEIVGRPPFRELLRVLPDLVRLGYLQLTVGRRARTQIARTQRAVRQLEAEDVAKLSERELRAMLPASSAQIVEDLRVVLLLVASLTQTEAVLRAICARVSFPYERLVHTQVAAGEKSVSAEQGFDLLRLARIARDNGGMQGAPFLARFQEFMRRYGHRGRYESDLALPRYTEDPAPLLFAIQAHVDAPDCPDPDLMAKRQDAEAATAWTEFEGRLTVPQRLLLSRGTRWLLRRAKQRYLWREHCRSEMMRLTAMYRARHLEIGRRLVARGWLATCDDYFMLTLNEIGAAIDDPAKGPELLTIVARRKIEREQWATLDMPLLMRESQIPVLARGVSSRSGETDTDTLHGLCVSPGYAEGEVVVMRDPNEFARMKRGAILVAPATDPAWTPLFTLASGVIVEVGGMLSHASTVAREYGLPALANVKHATRILKDGDRIRLDATNGRVTRERG